MTDTAIGVNWLYGRGPKVDALPVADYDTVVLVPARNE